MKLFKSLLVAPAALGLMTPLAVSASEVNLNDISNYSDVDSIEFANSFGKDEVNEKQLIAGGEGLVSGSSHDGGFAGTTTASFSTDFLIGAVDGDETVNTDKVMAAYSFEMGISTSFTDGDSLDITIDAGNSKTDRDANTLLGATDGVNEADGNVTADALKVDGVSYTFPLGGATAFVADNGDASALFTTACTYGGPTNTLDDCGNVNAGPTSGGVAFGSSYDFGNGFAAAVGYQATNAQENLGIMTQESKDSYAINGSYTGSNYGLSITYSSVEDGILSTSKEDTYTALNAYYTPDAEGMPSVSVGYEMGDDASKTTLDEITSFFVGLQWDEVGPGSLGAAAGHSSTAEGTEEAYMYEVYYSYPVNDSMTITPVIYVQETNTAGQDDATGLLVKTSFSF